MFFNSCHLLMTYPKRREMRTTRDDRGIRRIMKFLMIPAITFTCILVTHAQTSAIEGEWLNRDSNTRGLTRLVISRSEKGWNIGAWGKCHPKDCVWGSAVLVPLGNSVEDHSSDQGFAVWNTSFATRYMTLTFEDGKLAAEMITIFRDRSGRANFRSVDMFQRTDIAAR